MLNIWNFVSEAQKNYKGSSLKMFTAKFFGFSIDLRSSRLKKAKRFG